MKYENYRSWLIHHLLKQKYLLSFVFVSIILLTLARNYIPIVIGDIIDSVVTLGEESRVIGLLLLVLFLYLFNIIMDYISMMLGHNLGLQVDDFVKKLPKKYDTIVGERGTKLSGGERQNNILVLDEATSSVDAYTEAIIQEALDQLLKDRTSIIVAHRLSTVIDADRIIVMDQGKIVEEGTHQSLLKKGGKYTELYRKYFEHQSLDWQDQQKLIN